MDLGDGREVGRGLPARKEAVMMPRADAVRSRGRRSVILFFCVVVFEVRWVI